MISEGGKFFVENRTMKIRVAEHRDLVKANRQARSFNANPQAALAALVASAGEPIGRWTGVLAQEGEWTGDDRHFEPGALTWDTEVAAGMPLRWTPSDKGAHDDAVHVGWIDNVRRDESSGKIFGEGPFFDASFGDYLARAGKSGVSVDLDSEEYTVQVPEEAEMAPQPGGVYPALGQKKNFSAGRIRGATAVTIPAFTSGYIERYDDPTAVAHEPALSAAYVAPHAPAGSPAGGEFVSPDGVPGRAGHPDSKVKHRKRKKKPGEKLTQHEREVRLVKAILAALEEALGQLSSAQAKALIEQIKDRAEVFIKGSDQARKSGKSGGKSGGSSKSKSSDGAGSKPQSGGKSGGKKPGRGLPAGAEGIIEGVKRLLKHRGKNMKPATRQKLQSAVARLDSLTASAAPCPPGELTWDLAFGLLDPLDDGVAALDDENFIEALSQLRSVVAAAGLDTEDVDSDLNDYEMEGPTHAGVLLVAEDTGRWLMLQRALEEGDENGGLWEFPGGGLEEGEQDDPFVGASREFAEEVGVPLPDSARVVGGVQSGSVYRLYVVAVPEETALDIDGREVVNPDDPDGDLTEAVAWWTPEHLMSGGDHIRPEVQNTDWSQVQALLESASVSASAEFDSDGTRGVGDGPDGQEGRRLPSGRKGPAKKNKYGPDGTKKTTGPRRGPGRPRGKAQPSDNLGQWRKRAIDRIRSAINYAEGTELSDLKAALDALHEDDNAKAKSLTGKHNLDLGAIPASAAPVDVDPDLEAMFAAFRGNAETLREYWTTGKGGLKIRWGTPGDFTRCVKQVDKYMPGRAKGYCANLHKRMNGFWPGDKRNKASGEVADFGSQVPVNSGIGGKLYAEVTRLMTQGLPARIEKEGLMADNTEAEAPDEFIKALDDLDEAMRIHQGHLDGSIPTDDASQEQLMKLIADARTVLEDYVDYDEEPEAGEPGDDESGEAMAADISPETRDKAAEAGEAMPDGSYPIRNCQDLRDAVQAIGRAKDPEAVKTFIKKRAGELNCEGFELPEGWASETVVAAIDDEIPAPAPEAPGDLTEADTTLLESLRASHDGFIAELQSAVETGSLSPAVEELAKKMIGEIESATADVNALLDLQPDETDTLMASAAPVAPPDEWFEPFDLDGPTPLTITADGRVFGHLTTWDSCHRSPEYQNAGVCVRPPSDPAAPFFQLGQVMTASGKMVDIGTVTVGGGHADRRKGLVAAIEHYDDVATAGAVVKVHEDDYGVGLFGALVADATPEQVAALRRAPLSGDWRKERGKFRLVAAHAVNVPGFPIPRDMALVASVGDPAEDTTFITTGRVERCGECGEENDEPAVVASVEVPEAFRKMADEIMFAEQASLVASYDSVFEEAREEMRESLAREMGLVTQ